MVTHIVGPSQKKNGGDKSMIVAETPGCVPLDSSIHFAQMYQ
jgi:hypothetical protein